jgi:hypothetical protein
VTTGPTWFFAALEDGSIWYHSRVRGRSDCSMPWQVIARGHTGRVLEATGRAVIEGGPGDCVRPPVGDPGSHHRCG